MKCRDRKTDGETTNECVLKEKRQRHEHEDSNVMSRNQNMAI